MENKIKRSPLFWLANKAELVAAVAGFAALANSLSKNDIMGAALVTITVIAGLVVWSEWHNSF